jgi:two-component system, OmpR family, osmolarity sensor histidine kinase EnvZ
MARLGLVWRLAAIIVAALAVLQLTVMGIYYGQRGDLDAPQFRAPFAEQVVALARLLDGLPGSERELALRLANASGAHALLAPRRPPLAEDACCRLRPMERHIAAKLDSRTPEDIRVSLTQHLLGARLTATVRLEDGHYLVMEAAGELTVRLFGLPAGAAAGVLGSLITLLAVLAVLREMRPLSQLARSVQTFGDILRPEPLVESGAPEVRALIRAINHLQAHIAALLQSRTFVLAAISHDLRTYLTRLRLRMELVPDEPLRDQSIRDVEDMQAIVEESLHFARASLVPSPGGREDLAASVRATCEELMRQGKPVTFTASTTPLPVRASPAALPRIVNNLVGNALKYGGHAEVSVHGSASEVELWCEDGGPGIPVEERETIFEPFHRLERSRSREHGGMGLGLTIVRQLVEGLGGRVWVEERPGGGSRFRVRLPRA